MNKEQVRPDGLGALTLQMNGQKKAKTNSAQWDQRNPNERWWEDPVLVSEPFDFSAIAQYLPELEGDFWDALNRGVSQKAWKIAFALFGAFLNLPEREAKAFVLRASAGKSYREIGRALDVTHRAAKQIYERAANRMLHSIPVSTGYATKNCTHKELGKPPTPEVSNRGDR